MIEPNPKVKEALIKINFVERYEKLSNKYSKENTPKNKRLIFIDGEEVIDTIRDLGYFSSFDSKEKFYKLKEEKIEKFTFGFHIVLSSGMVDLIWILKEEDKLLLGAPWSVYPKRLMGANYRISKPIIGDYSDLEEILKAAFKMFEDFKNAIIQ